MCGGRVTDLPGRILFDLAKVLHVATHPVPRGHLIYALLAASLVAVDDRQEISTHHISSDGQARMGHDLRDHRCGDIAYMLHAHFVLGVRDCDQVHRPQGGGFCPMG